MGYTGLILPLICGLLLYNNEATDLTGIIFACIWHVPAAMRFHIHVTVIE